MSTAICTLALVTVVALASVSGFFGIVVMTAIFAAAAIPIMVSCQARHLCLSRATLWRNAPLLLRAPLTAMVLALMTLTAIGSYAS